MTPQQLEELTGSKGKLILATLELMMSRGYEGTSIQEILDCAQVTKSNFYYHFKSKEELCLAALETMENRFYSDIAKPTLLNPELPPKQRLEAFFQVLTARMENNQCCQGCPFSNLAAETSDFYPPFRERLAQFYGRKAQWIAQCLQEGLEQGQFRKDIDPAAVATFIISTMSGTLLLAKAFKNMDVVKQNTMALLTLVSTE